MRRPAPAIMTGYQTTAVPVGVRKRATMKSPSHNGYVSAIRCEVEPVGTRLVVRICGELAVSSAPRVRAALLKCLIEQPDAVVVDLAETVLTEPAAAAVFLAASRQAGLWPGTPMMISAPDPTMAQLLTGSYRRLAVFGSVAEALEALPRRNTTSISDVLLPVSGVGRRARELATEACIRWDLPQLTGPASSIANELTINAGEHAHTMADLQFTLGHRYLIVSVRDGCTAPPRFIRHVSSAPTAPRGLMLVDALAHRWGSLPTQNGKVVWAALRRDHGGG